jgi:hypothetical protein
MREHNRDERSDTRYSSIEGESNIVEVYSPENPGHRRYNQINADAQNPPDLTNLTNNPIAEIPIGVIGLTIPTE